MRLRLKEEEETVLRGLPFLLSGVICWVIPHTDPWPSWPLCHFLRASILEMRKDHEHQLQRLKMLKDQEIDAVTSATSHTRYVCCLLLLLKGALAVPRLRCPVDPPGP